MIFQLLVMVMMLFDSILHINFNKFINTFNIKKLIKQSQKNDKYIQSITILDIMNIKVLLEVSLDRSKTSDLLIPEIGFEVAFIIEIISDIYIPTGFIYIMFTSDITKYF